MAFYARKQNNERKNGPTVTYGEDKIKNVFLASGPMGSDKKTPNVHDQKAIVPHIIRKGRWEAAAGMGTASPEYV